MIRIENALTKDDHRRKRKQILDHFSVLAQCPHDHYLGLGKYLADSPERYFSRDVFDRYIHNLCSIDSSSQHDFQSYLLSELTTLDQALIHLNEINNYSWHEYFEKLDDYEFIKFIDVNINSSYLRLVEAVLKPFLHISAYFSRKARGAGTTGLDIWNIIGELEKSSLAIATAPYGHIMRNGIGHGGITYLQREILYKDKDGNEIKLGSQEIIKVFDNLLDTCNALALGLSVYLLVNQSKGYTLPQQIFINELVTETRAPWWEIIGCISSRAQGLDQLMIYARPKTSDYSKVLFSAIQSGILAEMFAPGFPRYFISIRSENSSAGWAGFDGIKLKELRNKPSAIIEDYKGVLEDSGVFYEPKVKLPAYLGRLNTLLYSFQAFWPMVLENIRKAWGRPKLVIRETTIHKSGWGSVVNGSLIVVPDKGDVTKELVKRSLRKIFKNAISSARHNASIFDLSRYLPVVFFRVGVFRKDYRRRFIKSSGLIADLICTIQVQRVKRIKSPDIMDSEIELIGRYRIAWNRAWLNNYSNL